MADKKLNVLFLSGWYPNRVLPTLGNFVQKHAESVALHSNVIALNAIADTACVDTFETTETVINNVHTINVYYKKVNHHFPLISQLQKYLRFKNAYALGLELVKQKFNHIDIVHHNILYPTGIIARNMKKQWKTPYIITEHSTAYLKTKNTQLPFLEKYISKKIAADASCITPVSNDLKKAMQSIGLAGNYEIIYNVVDTHLFQPLSNKAVSSKIKFLHISTLDDAHKNISGMLRAIAKLSEKRNDFEFYIMGDGDTSPHIQTAKELNIYNTFVFFEGTKTTVEVAAHMQTSDCFVLFSNYENLPVVIIEALACGIPVVSSNVGGIHEHITSEMGILVEARNEQQLTYALDKMIGAIQNKNYKPEQLAAYAKENFSYEKVSEKFHHLYRRILKQHV